MLPHFGPKKILQWAWQGHCESITYTEHGIPEVFENSLDRGIADFVRHREGCPAFIMKHTFLSFLLVCSLGCAASTLQAQVPDSRIWPTKTKQVELLPGKAWMEVPRFVKQDGIFLSWPTVQGFVPNINAIYEPFFGSIVQYRKISLPIFKSQGIRVLRDRVLFGRIWESELLAADGIRLYQRIFLTRSGVVAVTAAAKNRQWKQKYVTEMIQAMKTIEVDW